MTPEFFLVLRRDELDDELENAVYIAGFDDSELTMRGEKAAIWVCHRQGDLTQLVRTALLQAKNAGLVVDHVEIDSEVFAEVQ